jgi:hypothetical protein
MTKNKENQRGNALWFILLAIVLLGLLTMILSRGSSSVDQGGDYEQRQIKITQMLRYMKAVESAVQQLKLDGLSENEISFEGAPGTYTNPNCGEGRCRIFDVDGGGMTYKSPPNGMNDGSEYIFTGSLRVDLIGIDDNSASDSELLMIMPNVTQTYCIALNDALGVNNPSDVPPEDDGDSEATPLYVGSFSLGDKIDATDGSLDAKTAGCYEGGGTPASGTYHFYYVLLPR